MSNKYSVRDLVPLISIFTLIFAVTIGKQFLYGAWDLHEWMYDFMGIFFVVFGLFKISNLRMFAEAYTKYDIIAQHSKVYAYLYPFIEVSLGVLYLLRVMPFFTNAVTLVVMVISAIGVLRALMQKEPIMCACLGMVFKVPMTYVTLAEDLLMAAMAAYMFL